MSFALFTAHPALAATVLRTFPNLFMTFAWYGHLRNLQDKVLGAVYFTLRG